MLCISNIYKVPGNLWSMKKPPSVLQAGHLILICMITAPFRYLFLWDYFLFGFNTRRLRRIPKLGNPVLMIPRCLRRGDSFLDHFTNFQHRKANALYYLYHRSAYAFYKSAGRATPCSSTCDISRITLH